MSLTLIYPTAEIVEAANSSLPKCAINRWARIFLFIMLLLSIFLFPAKVIAACTFTPTTSTTSTLTLTSATISSASSQTITGTWKCTRTPSTIAQINPYICLKTIFTGTTSEINGSAMSYTVYGAAGGAVTSTNAVPEFYYGPARTIASSNIISGSVRLTIPASSTYYPAGTYTATVSYYIDMQFNSGSVCEGNSGGGWDSGSQTLTFNWVVPGVCSLVSTSTVAFGTITDIGSALTNHDGTGAIVTKCNYGTDYTIYLGDGNNRLSGSYRQMILGTSLMPYQLYKDSTYTTVWDDTEGISTTGGTGGVSSTGTGTNQTFVVYGRIPKGIALPATPGTYSDTVVVTVTY
ncbi:spore coat U domain-containing protein [Klebsiella oxytoca]|uniref:Csu type fimbrial protein n=1 Tax=Klebsiella oxytoca TaxID=571 RepID=UPI0039820FC9